jgi:hypothetical protein
MSPAVIRKGAMAVALVLILAACGQASAEVRSPSQAPADQPAPTKPAEPMATPRPASSPAPIATPEPEPTEEPAEPPVDRDPHQPTVVRHELPMVGRVTVDGVAVRELPDLDAPLVTGSSTTDVDEKIPNLRLDSGHIMVVTMGPLFADGVSWYYVHAESGPIGFAGWIAGEYIAREGGYGRALDAIDGYGTGGTLDLDVRATAPIVVTLGVNLVDGDDACHFSADVVRGDGSVVPISEGPVTGPMFGRAAAPDVADLVQTVDGTMTLRVETDCSFAASVSVLD